MSRSEPLRIVVAHNYYQQRGGEDAVAAAERDLLIAHGHSVEMLTRHNDELASVSNAKAAAQAIWSSESARRFNALADAFKPDILHVHNSFPLLSPSILWAASQHGIAVVQTVHNYRLLCPQGSFLRNGQPCEQCLGRFPWPGVAHACYRGSRAQSAILATMLGVHRAVGTYKQRVHRYIALSQFARDKLSEGGLPGERIVVKPNFVVDEGEPEAGERAGGLFVGRLSAEKGIATLIEAFASVGAPPLRIVGSGPLANDVGMFGPAALGAMSAEGVAAEMRRAAFLVVPSIWYEPFGLVAIEAFRNGLPVIASRIGGLAELVDDGRTGLLVKPNDPADLRRAADWAVANPERMAEMGRQARLQYLERFTPEANYPQLLAIYGDAMTTSGQDV